MKKAILFLTGLSFFILNNCTTKFPNEKNLPSWSVDISVPLVGETITVDDLIKGSLFVRLPFGTQGDSIIAYQDTIDIEQVEVGNQLKIDPISKSVSSQIGKIELNDTEKKQTEPIFFSEIVDLSGVPEGQTKTVSQGTQFPVIYRSVNFDNFVSAVFTSGELEISIVNNLVVELGQPITVRLLNADSSAIVGSDGDPAKAKWTVGILTGSTRTNKISLAGKTLPGEVIVHISGAICGSDSAIFTNNATTINSSFIVEVQAKNLAVSQAVAIIPEQQIDTTSIIALDQRNKVSRAQVLDGEMTLNVQNNLPVNIQLLLIVQSIDTTASPLVEPLMRSFSIPANQPSNILVPLDNFYLVMDIANQKVEYSYQILTRDTDPEKATLSETDNILVDLSIAGKMGNQVTFSMIEGIIDPVTVDLDTVEQEISAIPEELSGFDLNDVDITLIFETNIGVPVQLDLTLISYNEEGDTARSEVSQIITDDPVVDILNAADLINIKPKKIIAYGKATVGGAGEVDMTQYVKGVMHISVPMDVLIKGNAMIDIEPSLIKEDILEKIESATITARIENGFDFGGILELLVAKDTAYFEAGFPVAPDTLAILNLYSDSTFTETVILDETKFALFTDSLYVKPNIQLIGKKDPSGNPIPSRLMVSDMMKLRLSVIIRGLVDLDNNEDKESDHE